MKKNDVMIGVFLVLGVVFASQDVSGETERPIPARKPAVYTRTDDIIYGRKYGMALTMNLLKPANPNGAAVLWVISGGFFSSHEETLNAGFVARVEPLLNRGYTVFLVVHGSAPQFELREITKDIHCAVRFVRCHAGDYGIDPQRIGITGGSAGGYLATWLGTTGCDGNEASADPVERASSRVQAVACFFPGNDWMNFPNPGEDVIAISERLGTISGFRFKEYEPQKCEFIPVTDREKVRGLLKELSPINHVTAQAAPMLFIFGDKDTITTIQTQGTPMREKLKAVGVPCEIIVKPGLGHSWPGIEKDSESIADWFDKHLLGVPLTPHTVGSSEAADTNAVTQHLLAAHAATPLIIAENDLTLDGELGSFSASWAIQRPEPNLMLATLTLTAPQPATPPALSVKWQFPARDLAGIWVSDNAKANFDHQGVSVESRAVLRAPVLMLLGPDDGNRLTVALSDALRPAKLNCGVKEEDVNMYAEAKLFGGKQPPIQKYQVTFRIDTRTQPYYKVLRDTAQWWAAQKGYTPAPVPEAARVPLYSTWYSYHQSVDPATIINECRVGGELGLEGVIVDDGWQTLDSSRGYAFTGDWKPERIPEMKRFVDGIHALKQKFILWYSVPMAGEKSAAAKRFEGKTLAFSKGLGAHILDPRYPEVREYLIGLYENAVREWGIDGLKLDFIELFAPQNNTVLTAENGRDFASVDEAVDRLFTDIMARLRVLKPDIAIEFRQPYNGPLMRKYGNMLRGVDCPNAGPVNRKEIIDLRLLADHTAVHSDMIIWHPSEPVVSAALQLLNVLFSVPQVSVRLADVSPEHRTMIGFWLHYWKENRATLLDGELQPISPAANYPLVLARTQDKLIAALYQDLVIAPGSQMPAQIDVVNAKPGTSVVLRFEQAFGPATVRIRDCQGRQISEQVQILGVGVQTWEVPSSGLLEIRKK